MSNALKGGFRPGSLIIMAAHTKAPSKPDQRARLKMRHATAQLFRCERAGLKRRAAYWYRTGAKWYKRLTFTKPDDQPT